MTLSGVEALSPDHETHSFASGKAELDDWLARFALASHHAGASRVYVVHRRGRVVGYYALAAGAVASDQAPDRVRKGIGRHPIPVILLARMAVDQREQGRGLGAALLKDALGRAGAAAGEIGARAILVHAKDAEARRFYEHFNFDPSPTDPLHLFLLMKDVRALLGGEKR